MVEASRSKLMASIKSKNTEPEILVRSLLHQIGFRFRLHSKNLPGKPDIVLARHQSLINVNGCFWHGHNCHLFKMPSTRTDFWREKIHSNVARDKKNLAACRKLGWKTLVVWECAIKGKTRLPSDELANVMQNWLLYDNQDAEIAGRQL